MLLWGHEPGRSNLIDLKLVARKWNSTSKVHELKVVVLVKQNVFWLNVSMSNFLLVAILYCFDELSEVEPSNVFLQTASFADDIK